MKVKFINPTIRAGKFGPLTDKRIYNFFNEMKAHGRETVKI